MSIIRKTWGIWTLSLKIMGKSDLDLVRQFDQFGHFDQFYCYVCNRYYYWITIAITYCLSKYKKLHYLELAGSNRIYSIVIGKRASCFIKSGNLASLEMKQNSHDFWLVEHWLAQPIRCPRSLASWNRVTRIHLKWSRVTRLHEGRGTLTYDSLVLVLLYLCSLLPMQCCTG